MNDPMIRLRQEHDARNLQRQKIQAPIHAVTAVLFLAGAGLAAMFATREQIAPAVACGIAGLVLAIVWAKSAHLLAEWDRAVILRMGRFHSVKGPGMLWVIPIVDSIQRVVDMRIRTTPFISEAMLTKDTVPVGVDAIAFWHVWNAEKAVLEVESYYHAIVLAVQTALRDIVGLYSLAELLAERDQIGQTLQQALADKTQAWGISVTSIEIRDISIPDTLKDALSKQAQAERERHSRTILGQA